MFGGAFEDTYSGYERGYTCHSCQWMLSVGLYIAVLLVVEMKCVWVVTREKNHLLRTYFESVCVKKKVERLCGGDEGGRL